MKNCMNCMQQMYFWKLLLKPFNDENQESRTKSQESRIKNQEPGKNFVDVIKSVFLPFLYSLFPLCILKEGYQIPL